MLNVWLKTSQSTSKDHLKHQDLIISGVQKPLADNRKAQLADTSAKLQKLIFIQVKQGKKTISESTNLHKLGGTTPTNCENGGDKIITSPHLSRFTLPSRGPSPAHNLSTHPPKIPTAPQGPLKRRPQPEVSKKPGYTF